MPRSRTLCLALLLIALLAVAGACGSTDKPEGVTGGGSGAPSSTFTYATHTQVVVGWDPATSYSNEIIAMHNIYETLTRYNSESQEVEPLLATSWERSEDGKTWTFELRDDVRFHTGRKMDAQAAKAAIDRTIELNGGAAYLWASVKSIEATGPTTLTFTLKYPAPLDLISSAAYAAYIYDTTAGDADLAEWFEAGNEAGTGPYTVSKWSKGEEIELRLGRFDDYWGGWEGTKYQNVVYRVVPTANTAAQLVRSGEVTFVEQLSPQLWESLEGADGVTTTSGPSFQNLLAMLNTQSGPLADVRVRRAFAHAVDVDGIVTALQGSVQPSSGIVPPGLLGHFDDLPTHERDVEKAKRLLAEAGYGEGDEVRLEATYTQGDPKQQTVATLLKSQLAEVGITLDLKALQWPTQWEKAKSTDPSKRQDLLVFWWWPDYADPYSWFVNLFRSADPPYFNLAYYENPQVDKDIDRVEAVTATDREQAEQIYRDLQEQVIEDVPAIPLFETLYQRAMLDEVGGFVENPAYPNVVFVHELTPGGS
jgi:peptide/nickel transport system substrate-binding protein